MDDNEIIKLFNERKEKGLSELSAKYGNYLTSIAEKMLNNHEDALSCVNDAYLKAWNSIPPAKPNVLRAFVGKIVKTAAIGMLRMSGAGKRGGGEIELVFEELDECISDNVNIEDAFEQKLDEEQTVESINKFLKGLSEFNRRVFVLRYWYCESVSEIAGELGNAENKVSVSLYRTRKKLREYLEKEGYSI